MEEWLIIVLISLDCDEERDFKMAQNETVLNITRLKSFISSLRSFTIVVDGKEIGTIKVGETVRLSVEPGNHRIFLKIDWCRSNIIDFVAKAKTEHNLECGTSLTGLRIFLVLLYITFWWNKYLWIRKMN